MEQVKGYLVTILSFLLVASVFSLTVFYSDLLNKQSQDVNYLKSLEKIQFVKDNLETETGRIFGLSASFYSNGSMVFLNITDIVPFNVQPLLEQFKNYTERNYSSKVFSNISFEPFRTNFSIQPYGISYGYNSFSKDMLLVQPMNIAGRLSIIIEVLNKSASAMDSADSNLKGGAFPIYVKFLAGGQTLLEEEGNLIDLSQCSFLKVNFTNGGETNISIGNCGYPNSLIVNKIGTLNRVNISIELNNSYNASMLYTGFYMSDKFASVNTSMEIAKV